MHDKHKKHKIHASKQGAMGTWKNPGAQGAYMEAPPRGNPINGCHKKHGTET